MQSQKLFHENLPRRYTPLIYWLVFSLLVCAGTLLYPLRHPSRPTHPFSWTFVLLMSMLGMIFYISRTYFVSLHFDYEAQMAHLTVMKVMGGERTYSAPLHALTFKITKISSLRKTPASAIRLFMNGKQQIDLDEKEIGKLTFQQIYNHLMHVKGQGVS
jgi:hypothetical protein